MGCVDLPGFPYPGVQVVGRRWQEQALLNTAELFGVHYGSFFDDEAGLLALMEAEEAFMKMHNCQATHVDRLL
jgi:hypothetical protein